MLWNINELSRRPRSFAAKGLTQPGVRGLFYEGEPWHRQPTRVFAWYGAPAVKPGETVPAMILVHGGGGTAFADWVRLWTARGYAALAMDTGGGVPGWCENPFCSNEWPRHKHSGPNGWGRFEETSHPPRDQWMFHAVAAVIRGHSLLRSFPEVDPARIGITGVSWGAVLTCVAASLDPRFQFAAPVYGCGFLDDPSSDLCATRPPDRWFKLWDPARYLPKVRLPMLWVTGTNDFAFPLTALQKSYRHTPGPHTLSIRVRMPHGHGGPSEKPEEIRVFADALTQGARPLPHITGQAREGSRLGVSWRPDALVSRVELNFTRATGHWTDRFWNTVPSAIASSCAQAMVEIPKGSTAAYFNVFDNRDCVVSSEHVEFGA